MAIQRPKDLITSFVWIRLNDDLFDQIEIDLDHINNGGDGTRNTCFTSRDIEEVASLFLDKAVLAGDTKRYDQEICIYYCTINFYKYKLYKLVVCVCSDRPRTLGIITFYQIGE